MLSVLTLLCLIVFRRLKAEEDRLKDEAERLTKWEKDRNIEQDMLRDIIEAREAEEARIITAKDVYEAEKDKAEKVFLHDALSWLSMFSLCYLVLAVIIVLTLPSLYSRSHLIVRPLYPRTTDSLPPHEFRLC